MPDYRIKEILLDAGTNGTLLGFCLEHRKTGELIEAMISRKSLDEWLRKIDDAVEKTILVPKD